MFFSSIINALSSLMYLDVSNIKNKITVFLNKYILVQVHLMHCITKTPIIPESFLFRLIRVFVNTFDSRLAILYSFFKSGSIDPFFAPECEYRLTPGTYPKALCGVFRE